MVEREREGVVKTSRWKKTHFYKGGGALDVWGEKVQHLPFLVKAQAIKS
jgi:hypothetical protein